MKAPEYIEGHKAKEQFERTMTTLFKAPKPKKMDKAKPKRDKKGKD